ncbi:predicted protein [Uncinocarpus reesii 1704]|uniref:Uncharacterized protein n=1 Tax=Uncinocarpus reesii (strain UAMH 1704) TaxID=336963 RepID=C4JJ34_UNCRE|nr:uncharacterized protein UREG_01641 [Uncinocarpus reesii 1704]EEP76792.1 predicted protein [Uncinocarpus reesii 1704]
MATRKYLPFDSPRKVGWEMARLFERYWASKPDYFTFEWLQDSNERIEFCCKNATEEEVDFTTSPALLEAIHSCQELSSGELPSDFGFTGFTKIAVHEVGSKVEVTEDQEFMGPLFWKLRVGLIVDHHRRIYGPCYFEHRPDHWSCIMRDQSPHDEVQSNSRNYSLKSEIVAVAAIMYRQMNEIIQFVGKEEAYARLRYESGPLTVTVVTFTPGKVRVVQAICSP